MLQRIGRVPVTRWIKGSATILVAVRRHPAGDTGKILDLCPHSCMHESMKTITLDEVAYKRLKDWKKGSSESFSSVVKRVLPEPGSLGAFLAFVERRGTCARSGNDVLEEAVESRSSVKSDPWI